MEAELTVRIRAMSPISHGSFGEVDAGNASTFRRFDVVFPDGRTKRIPALSSNSIRGQLRRIVMRDLLERTNLSATTLDGKAWDRLYAALANGGHLEKSEARIDPAAMRRLREELPQLSLFGAACFSFFVEGRLKPLGQVWPVSRELVDLGLYDGLADDLPFAESLISEVSLVRHVDREEQTPEVSGVTPMPTTVETLATGTRLIWRVRYSGSTTEVERAILPWALDRLPHLGGKNNAGFGAVEVECLGGSPDAYQAWLDTTPMDKVEASLRALAVRLA